jgi:hypothetical protein
MEIFALNRPIEIHNKVQMYSEVSDDEYLQLQNIIEAKRNMLIRKQKQLKHISKYNNLLQQVRNDYSKYNDYIVKQKHDQLSALHLLNTYIDDLTRSGNLSKNNIKDAKIEQRKIVKELNSIKHGLDKIVNDVDFIKSNSS